MAVIGFGKCSRFYMLILYSTLIKILTSILFKMDFQYIDHIEDISIVIHRVLDQHIFVRFIYYYLGLFILRSITANTLAINKEFFNYETLKEKYERALRPIYLVVIIYIIYEILTFYFEQRNLVLANFWIIQLFFIHFLLSKRENLKLFNHQKLSFAIILFLSFGTSFVSSFFKQCEYQEQTGFSLPIINNSETMVPIIIENITNKTEVKDEWKERGERACRNKYNFFIILNGYFEYFFVIAAFGYLIALFLKSFSIFKLKSLINQNFILIDKIIILIGSVGFILNIILLSISSLIPCPKGDHLKYCTIEELGGKINSPAYFDNIRIYIEKIIFYLFQKGDEYMAITPQSIIIEIIFYFIFPIFGFFKMRLDLSIIKELGVFHLLIPEIIYQFVIDCYIIIYKIVNNMTIDKAQIIQFIFAIISHLFGLIGILIYLELIELRFCKSDKDTNKNIALRANEDVEYAEDIEEMTEMNPFLIRDSLLDKNKEEKKND